MSTDYTDLRRELPSLARSLGLAVDLDARGGYTVRRGDNALAYCATPPEAKAFLRGYQHGHDLARAVGSVGP